MKFHEFGSKKNPHIMLIHGGGNAWWNYLRQARALSDRYHVILPTLDGHGEEYALTYKSTEDSADKLMAYIEENCGGHLFALGGVSLGGQIVMELLSRKADITRKAIIDGSLCFPQPGMARYCMAVIRFAAGLCSVKRPAAVRSGGCRSSFRPKCSILRKYRHIISRTCPVSEWNLWKICTVLIWLSTG